MREISTPLLVNPEGTHRNTTDLLEHRLRQAPQHIAFEVPHRGASGSISNWKPISTAEFAARVRRLAKALIASGVQAGDRVLIMSATCFDWAVADLAIMYAGATVVPVYETSSLQQVKMILRDSDAVFAFTGTPTQRQLMQEAANSEQIPSVGVLCFEDHQAVTAFTAQAAGITDEELERRRTLPSLDDVATLVYTSGTTGVPKGAKITHRNLVGQVLNVAAAYREVVHERGSTVIFLPLAHVLARGLQFACIAGGMRVAHLAEPKELIAQLPSLKPSFLVLVPRVLEKISERITAQAESKKLGAVWEAARRTACERSRLVEQGLEPHQLRPHHRLAYGLFDRLFYRRVRGLLGGQLDWVLTGGAPLDAELAHLFTGMGVPVIEGYGLTETTAPIAGNLPGRTRSGSVGVALPGGTIRISDTGEILVRGIGVFDGYTDEDAAAAAFEDGFFRTGDTGFIEDGFLFLRGRLKDEIVTSYGKSVSPYVWESAVGRNPLIAHAVMVGEGRSYLTALVIPDTEAVMSAGLDAEAVRVSIAGSVEQANALVSHSEQVKRFTLVQDDLTDPILITPTQKLKRSVFVQRWADEIDALYS